LVFGFPHIPNIGPISNASTKTDRYMSQVCWFASLLAAFYSATHKPAPLSNNFLLLHTLPLSNTILY